MISLTLDPAPGSTAPVTSWSITIEAEATDPDTSDKVKRVQFFLDGELIGEDFTPESDVFTLFLPNDLWAGSHTITARAVDTHRKTAEDQETSVVSGNHAPVAGIASPEPRAEFQASAGSSGTADIRIEILASDTDAGDSLASVEVEVTKGGAMNTYAATLDGSVYRVTLEDQSPGTYFLRAKATDSSSSAAGRSAVVKGLVLGGRSGRSHGAAGRNHRVKHHDGESRFHRESGVGDEVPERARVLNRNRVELGDTIDERGGDVEGA